MTFKAQDISCVHFFIDTNAELSSDTVFRTALSHAIPTVQKPTVQEDEKQA